MQIAENAHATKVDRGGKAAYVDRAGAETCSIVERNIRSLHERRAQEEANSPLHMKLAQGITKFTGTMSFICAHFVLYSLWVAANLAWIPGVHPWDKEFSQLALIAAVEALFMAAFVLVAQNHMAAVADKRADLDLQITLLTEHELTKMATLLSSIAERIGVQTHVDADIDEVKRDVSAEAVLDEIEATQTKETAETPF